MGVLAFRSTDGGAPTLSGSVGSLTDLLYACLVTGFNTKTLDSLTRDGTTVTATVAAGHGFATGQTVRIAGANEPDYNGDFVVTSTGSTTFTYTIAATPTTPATGTITAKRAPLGWSRPYSGTNKAVFRGAAGTQLYLRVDDAGPGSAGAREAFCRGYETMSDVDTGEGPFPTTGQLSTGIIWRKSDTLNTAARNWDLAGDDRFVYLSVDAYSGSIDNRYLFYFGDIVSYKVGDIYHCVINGKTVQNSSQLNGAAKIFAIPQSSISYPEAFIARGYSQGGGSTAIEQGGLFYPASAYYYSGDTGFVGPNPVDNGYHLSPVYIQEVNALRGKLPGLWSLPYVRPFSHWGALENVENLSGRTLRAVNAPELNYESGSSTTDGQFMLDVTGPWR